MAPLHEHHEPQRHPSNILPHTGPTRIADNISRSTGIPPRLRNDESWVEISSQPSSSSLSSIGDEIVTTGLRVQHDPNSRRRRRGPGPLPITLEARQTSTSSQEEYEESESEEDHVMTSSNEHIIAVPTQPEYDAESESDDDENVTALGKQPDAEPVFTPQPNAFSHPPSSRGVPNSYFPHSYSNTRTSHPPLRNSRQNSSYNHAADHDAALRASLTTLLSIGAAAARGLPKRENVAIPTTEPMGLRFISEAELLGPIPQPNISRPLSPSPRARSSPSISSAEAAEKGKRKASTTKPAGEKSRALKKKRTQVAGEEQVTLISPTLLTWVMSAGVVVLFSVVGFGAGYVIGREVGRGEALAGLNGSSFSGAGCGKEAVRGTGTLRRLKWGIGGGGKAVVA